MHSACATGKIIKTEITVLKLKLFGPSNWATFYCSPVFHIKMFRFSFYEYINLYTLTCFWNKCNKTLFQSDDSLVLQDFIQTRDYCMRIGQIFSDFCFQLTLEASKKKITRNLEGGGGPSDPPPPLLLLTQLIRLTWNLVHITSFICTFN